MQEYFILIWNRSIVVNLDGVEFNLILFYLIVWKWYKKVLFWIILFLLNNVWNKLYEIVIQCLDQWIEEVEEYFMIDIALIFFVDYLRIQYLKRIARK